VEIAPGPFDGELELEDAARAEGDGGAPAPVLGPVGDEHDVGGEKILWASVNGPKEGLPISSSPSKMNFTLTAGGRSSSSMRARASRWDQIGPLSSEAPRA
jgi:hypothetical protein